MRVIRMVSSGAGIDQKGIQKNLLGFWNSFLSICKSKLIDPQTLKICAFPFISVKIKTFIQNTFIVYIFQQFYSVFSKTFQGAESDFSEIQTFFSHVLLLSHGFRSLPQKIQFPIQLSQSPVFEFSFFCPSHLHSVRTSQLVLHITDVDCFYCFHVQILILKFYLESLIKFSQCMQLPFYFSC